MEKRVLKLIGDLRRAGVKISPSEAGDSLAATTEVGLCDRDTFKEALAATLVKTLRDRSTFDELFDLYFPNGRVFVDGLRKALGPEDAGIHELIDRLLAEERLEIDGVSELLLRGWGREMEVALGSAGIERLMSSFRIGEFSRRIYDGLDWAAIERDFHRIMEMLEARGVDPARLARIRCYLEQRLEAIRRMIRKRAEREAMEAASRQEARLAREVLARKPLLSLTAEEVAEMKAVVARLAGKIRDALARRQGANHAGRIDSRRTIRKSLQYGGVPMEVVLRHRRPVKPKLVTICDVSDSVGYASRFMLQLVWSLQECFSRVRSYVFVADLAEVTQAFKRYPLERAIEWALREAPVDYHGQSDFGCAFSRFAGAELEGVDSKTTVLVLGDARNNYNDPQECALRLIRERAKGVIWLNPQSQREWGLADSVMPLYARSCDLVRECRTVRQLAEAIESLAPHWWRSRG